MLILASASPRRRELMRMLAHEFEAVVANADESILPGQNPHEAVEALALRKAEVVAAARPDDVVIGADTVVVLDGEILGKPRDNADAAAMLSRLSGKTHAVYTGVAVLAPTGKTVFSERASVTFYSMTAAEIEAYVATGEPMDKAGAYGIQGRGGLFVRGIKGDFYNIMGLPVALLYHKLREMRLL